MEKYSDKSGGRCYPEKAPEGRCMEKYYPILKKTLLFNNFEDSELSHFLSCLRAHLKEYKAGSDILLQGSDIACAGIIVKGKVLSHRVDIDGTKRILTMYGQGEVFFDELLFSHITVSPYTMTAKEQTAVIYIDCSEISKFCNMACVHHSKFVANLMQKLSEKTVRLDQKMEIVQQGSVREKLLAYFNLCADQAGSNQFNIPFSRQELADYIGVNRSTTSRELWKLKRDGLINFDHRDFVLKTLSS